MYDLIIFVLGVWTGRLIWRAAQQSRVREIVTRSVLVAALLVIYFLPSGYDKVVYKWETLPEESYVIPDGTSVGDWEKYGVATVYTNNREFLNSADNTPVLIYNPASYTADEARAEYKKSH